MDGERTAGLSLAALGLHRYDLVVTFLLVMIGWSIGLGPAPGWADVSATSRILPTGDALELTYQANGETWRDLIPLHRAGAVRYFSAGVGMAERAAEYPPFPIKLVLTAGGKPYLARVGVQIVSHGGAITLSIPPEHVTGPWLFLDLPAGTYDLTGIRGDDMPQLRRVTVQPGSSQTLYLRFAGE
ncbi:MAG: hypothetical protein NW703_16165 [Nitrospiraceae bacterium]